MMSITKRYKTPQFTFAVGTAITMQGSPWAFRVAIGAAGQTKSLAEYAVKKLAHKKIAVLYSDDEYGTSMAEGFKKALESMELQPATYESYPREAKDFSEQLTKLKNSGATALYPTGSFVRSALIARQAKQLGLELQLLRNTGNATPKFIVLGGDAVEGAVIVKFFTPADPNPKVQEFVKKSKEQYGRDPDSWVSEMYDTVEMVHEAVSNSRKVEPQEVKDYVAELKIGNGYKGILKE